MKFWMEDLINFGGTSIYRNDTKVAENLGCFTKSLPSIQFNTQHFIWVDYDTTKIQYAQTVHNQLR